MEKKKFWPTDPVKNCLLSKLETNNLFSVFKIILMYTDFALVFVPRFYLSTRRSCSVVKAMDDIGVVMTPFGDVVTVILVVYSYVLESS